MQMEAQYERMQQVAALKERMAVQRKVTTYRQEQKVIRWKLANKAVDRRPGPGQYGAQSDFNKYAADAARGSD